MSTVNKKLGRSITLITITTLVLGVLVYWGLYVPHVHAQKIKVLEMAYEGKEKLVEETLEETRELITDLTKEIQTQKQEVDKALADAKQKEQKLYAENTALKTQVTQLTNDKKTLVKQVSTTKQQLALANKATQTKMPSRGSSNSGKSFYVDATAYTGRCSGCSGITKTGIDVRYSTPSIIAVDPRVIPLGTKVELRLADGTSLGYYSAEDTGGDIIGNRIDILMSSHSKAINFGNQKVIVRILGK